MPSDGTRRFHIGKNGGVREGGGGGGGGGERDWLRLYPYNNGVKTYESAPNLSNKYTNYEVNFCLQPIGCYFKGGHLGLFETFKNKNVIFRYSSKTVLEILKSLV